MNSKEIKYYYRLAKPGIIYGNLLMAVAGYLFASHWHNAYLKLIMMLLGLGLIIGCGCVVNNVIDKDIDSQMDRTKKRSLVTGEIKPKEALIYAAILVALGVIILAVFTNSLSLILALLGLFLYVVIYGLAKRKSVYGTLIGSLSGAIPPLVGYVAFSDNIDTGAALIFLLLIFWQLGHFYAIALYRKKEYAAAKIPVWPVIKGDWSAELQTVIAIILFTLIAISIFIFGYGGYIYLLAVLILGGGWLWYSVVSASKLSAQAWGHKTFKSSLYVLTIMAILLAVGPILP